MVSDLLLGMICLQLGMISLQLYLLSRKPVFDPMAPTNVYGEGLVDGIQNAIERGQRGISTHG